jgi:hypothetical protein
MKSIARMRWAGLLAVALSVAACGGGNGDGGMTDPPGSPGADTQVPAAAAASSGSLIRFLKGLVDTEVGEPLQVGTFDPPRAETAEPEQLD